MSPGDVSENVTYAATAVVCVYKVVVQIMIILVYISGSPNTFQQLANVYSLTLVIFRSL